MIRAREEGVYLRGEVVTAKAQVGAVIALARLAARSNRGRAIARCGTGRINASVANQWFALTQDCRLEAIAPSLVAHYRVTG